MEEAVPDFLRETPEFAALERIAWQVNRAWESRKQKGFWRRLFGRQTRNSAAGVVAPDPDSIRTVEGRETSRARVHPPARAAVWMPAHERLSQNHEILREKCFEEFLRMTEVASFTVILSEAKNLAFLQHTF